MSVLVSELPSNPTQVVMPITSTFVGNHAITWEPGALAPPQQAPIDGRKEAFNAFLKLELEKFKNKTGGYKGALSNKRAEISKHMTVLRAVLHDPSPVTLGTNDFGLQLDTAITVIEKMMAAWANKPLESTGNNHGADTRRTAARGPADKAAQKDVPSWDGLHCPLIGVSVLDAAHVVDV